MSNKEPFKGLPMEQLIGAPLSAICEGQVMLASATKDYIENVGLDENNQVRMIDFTFQRPMQIEQDDGDISLGVQDVKVSVPFISIVSVPTLQVDSARIDFTMEVKATQYMEEKNSEQTDPQSPPPPKTAMGLSQKSKPTLIGNVTKKESASAATFKVEVSAKQAETPEGLSRLMDILHRHIAPVEIGEPKVLKDNK
ncbi:DUF2589 domain-containing protein [Thalassomonas viridans]|uniref:DUF2589 domain-containing protein n=1 Tax=Thalassomonas viridans TaxID=137584 RepID=A0AAE9Z4K1_9GAMM|nr:DUF2589 domain-containing protein [Thalassomonas viridans]WDE06535.1 DUF2589 domain-containing protein [Thalassomonas viridans]